MSLNEFDPKSQTGGRWISARQFSVLTGISIGVLANWRTADRKRGEIRVGRPIWRRFSGCIRYWLPDDLLHGAPDPGGLGLYRPRRRRAGVSNASD